MSDPRLDATLHAGGKTYTLRFTHTALALAERLLGMKVPDIAMMVGSGRFGFSDVTCLTTAGLEGARRKLRLGPEPWTVEKVEDLLEDVENFDAMATPVVESLQAALRRWFPDLYEEADAALGGDDQDPPTAAGTGTDSSEPPSEPASEPTTSGG